MEKVCKVRGPTSLGHPSPRKKVTYGLSIRTSVWDLSTGHYAKSIRVPSDVSSKYQLNFFPFQFRVTCASLKGQMVKRNGIFVQPSSP